jgi:hypothetical protein
MIWHHDELVQHQRREPASQSKPCVAHSQTNARLFHDITRHGPEGALLGSGTNRHKIWALPRVITRGQPHAFSLRHSV